MGAVGVQEGKGHLTRGEHLGAKLKGAKRGTAAWDRVRGRGAAGAGTRAQGRHRGRSRSRSKFIAPCVPRKQSVRCWWFSG